MRPVTAGISLRQEKTGTFPTESMKRRTEKTDHCFYCICFCFFPQLPEPVYSFIVYIEREQERPEKKKTEDLDDGIVFRDRMRIRNNL